MTEHERELLLLIAKSIHNLERGCAEDLGRDPMTNQTFKRRQELIELVEVDAYAERIAAATREFGQ